MLLAVAVLVHLGAFFYSVRYPAVRWMGDTGEYLTAGRNLLEHGVFYSGDLSVQPLDSSLYSRRPPLYPLFLAVTERFPGGLDATAFLQMLLAWGAAWLSYCTALLLLPASAHRFAIWVPIALLLYPTQVIYAQVLMAEIPLQFLLALAAYGTARFFATRETAYLWASNAALALAPLAKPVMLPFWLPNLLFHAWLSWKSRVRTALAAALLPLVVITAWSLRNLACTGTFHFSSLVANQAKVLVEGLEPLEARGKDLGSEYRQAVEKFVRRIGQAPLSFLLAYGRGIASFFLDPGMFDLYEFLDRAQPFRLGQVLFREKSYSRIFSDLSIGSLLYLTTLLLWNGAVTLGFLLFLARAHRSGESRWFLALLVVYMALAVGPIGRSRYRLPVEPLLLVASAAAFSEHRNIRLRRSRNRGPSHPERKAHPG
ncbi:MAG: hypothetical protein Kow00109_29440 [Acidobacteriota bacterium]